MVFEWYSSMARLFKHYLNKYIMKKSAEGTFVPGTLKGKTVVITGASSGVGYAAALAFARQGARLVLAARREQALNDVVKQCEEAGALALAVKTDVTVSGDVNCLAAKAFEFGGSIDVWVNNAGVLAGGGFSETPIEIHEQVIRTNLMGYVFGAHAALPYFKKQRSGVLINNISVGGWFPTPYMVSYSASKFGLRGFSESLQAELSKWPGIHVCNLFPAFLDTPGIQHAGNYTGAALKPAPPVYDPQRVARAMVSVARFPRKSVTVGSASTFLRLAHFFLPVLSGAITAKVMEAYFRNAESTAPTSGNILVPVDFGTSIHGGWSKAVEPGKKKMVAAMLIGGLLAGFFIVSKSGRK